MSVKYRSSMALRSTQSARSPAGMLHTSACFATRPQGRPRVALGPVADEDRGSAQRLRVAERASQVDLLAVEVEGFLRGPQPAHDGARLVERGHGVVGPDEGDVVREYSRRAAG